LSSTKLFAFRRSNTNRPFLSLFKQDPTDTSSSPSPPSPETENYVFVLLNFAKMRDEKWECRMMFYLRMTAKYELSLRIKLRAVNFFNCDLRPAATWCVSTEILIAAAATKPHALFKFRG
jgi:hypothetical protein